MNNMATTDITLDGAEFSDLTAPYKGWFLLVANQRCMAFT